MSGLTYIYRIHADGPTRRYLAAYAITAEELDLCAINLHAYLLDKLLHDMERKMREESHSIFDTRFVWTMSEEVRSDDFHR